MTVRSSTAALLLVALAGLQPVLAQETARYDSNVFFFGGRYTEEFFEYSFNPIAVNYENNFVLGGGYQHFLFDAPFGVRVGVEAGTALRFGDSNPSGEVWGGVVGRYDNLFVADHFSVNAAVSLGVSAATGTVGIERGREIDETGDSSLLWYLGPEISITPHDNPNLEFFWRVHHRSGGWKSLGNMRDGANANSIGVRWKF